MINTDSMQITSILLAARQFYTFLPLFCAISYKHVLVKAKGVMETDEGSDGVSKNLGTITSLSPTFFSGV